MENEKKVPVNPANVENPALLWAMESYFESQTPEKLKRIHELLAQAQILVPVVLKNKLEPSEDGKQQRAEFNLRLLKDKDGKTALPLFTDEEQRKKGAIAEGEIAVVMGLQQIGNMLATKGEVADVVINPFGGRALKMQLKLPANPNAAAGQNAANDPNAPKTINLKPEDVTTRPLTEIPEALCGKLTELLSKAIGVRRAWLVHMESGENNGILCVVDFENLNQQVLFPALARTAQPHTNGQKFFACAYDNFGKKSAGQTLPFYTRSEQAGEGLVM